MSIFVPNLSGMRAVGRSDDVRRACERRAKAVAARAQSIVAAEAYETGELHNSIHVEDHTGEAAEFWVIAGTDHADDVEFGTIDTPRVRFLGRAADAKEL